MSDSSHSISPSVTSTPTTSVSSSVVLPRRFVPEVVETTSRSSRASPTASAESRPKRRFAPEPIETTSRSSKDVSKKDDKPVRTASKSRFAPQLLETTTSSTRAKSNSSSNQKGSSTSTPAAAASARRFAPQLLGSESRSSKLRSQTAIENPGQYRPSHLNIPPASFAPENSPVQILSPELTLSEARRLGKSLPPRRHSLELPARQHSFSVPQLETIESSESEVSDSGSYTSPSSVSGESTGRFKKGPFRGGVDVLSVAAKAAEKQLLQEQGLAAFPNDDRHVRVHHFVDRDNSGTVISRQLTEYYRRDSDLELQQMQQYRTRAEQDKAAERLKKEKRRKMLLAQRGSSEDLVSLSMSGNPWRNPFEPSGPRLHAVKTTKAGDRTGADVESDEHVRMKERARPPMLGDDIKFVRCQSPEPARFDVTQGSYSVRNAMCYLTEQSDSANKSGVSETGMWCSKAATSSVQVPPKSSVQVPPTPSATPSLAPSPSNFSTTSSGLWGSSTTSKVTTGLWGGCCTASNATSPTNHLPTGLMTPRTECGSTSSQGSNSNSIDSKPMPLHHLPPSPPSSAPNSGIQILSSKLQAEEAIEAEYDDAFITQVYNYLSLGYGSVAQRYDNEISKVTKADVANLRADDDLAQPRGYLSVHEDIDAGGLGVSHEHCARWKALRSYIHEWARQQPDVANGLAGSALAVRKGSWAG